MEGSTERLRVRAPVCAHHARAVFTRRATWVALLCTVALSTPLAARADPSARRLLLVPMGPIEPALFEEAEKVLRERFRFDLSTAPQVALSTLAWYAPRKRWRAEKLLDQLDALGDAATWRVLGLTEASISTTKGKIFDWGIAGLARIDGKSGIVTSFIYRKIRAKSRAAYRRYFRDLVLHEVGHTLGLDHCPLRRCLMADAKGNALRSARASSGHFCPRCTARIASHLRDPAPKGRWSRHERAALKRATLAAPATD